MMEAVCDVFWRQSVCGALALQIVGKLPAKNGQTSQYIHLGYFHHRIMERAASFESFVLLGKTTSHDFRGLNLPTFDAVLFCLFSKQ